MLIELLVLFVLPALAEDIPDYNSPYSPIFTDKQTYTWTDKIQVTIAAPSWNTNRHLIDSIGGDDENPIRISTREHSLEPYRFTETEPNSGVFAARVTLTGFLHDVDGDGNFDTAPRTLGSGPTGGFLEVDRDAVVTISFEFADGVFVTESIPITWNVGRISFSEEYYSFHDTAQIRVTDYDLNLNPDALDQIPIIVSSDSDDVGVVILATESGQDTGVFVVDMSFTQDRPTSRDKLYAIPGDVIHARYEDHTLPEPYSKSDSLNVMARTGIISDMTLDRITNSEILFADGSGNLLEVFSVAERIQVVSSLTNKQDFLQPFVYLLQVKDDSGYVVSISWIRGDLGPLQTVEVSQSWFPEYSGNYTVDAFVWDSLAGQTPLTLQQYIIITVG
ncbi:MAG: hypothetical protein OXC46_11110 [Thaumarchaeota archaeon]|nr:hypothetical protein [Nitrososphaerota archaeon]